jgi:type III restriction enzyme
MEIQLEDLEYQRRAIAAVVGVLEGQVRNSFDNSNLFGIQANVTDLTPAQIEGNKKKIISENGVAEADAKLAPENDICIEMETGTGKTLVYFRTIYELYQRYRLTKFIILVPSIAIKEGVLKVSRRISFPFSASEPLAAAAATSRARTPVGRKTGVASFEAVAG